MPVVDTAPPGQPLIEMRTWDGSTREHPAPAEPALTYDAAAGRVVVCGGGPWTGDGVDRTLAS